MANDNTVLLGGDAADGIREITDLLTNAQTSLDEMAVSAGNFGEQIAAQMNSVKGACDTASEAMNNLNQVQYEDLAGALETVKQHLETDVLQPITNEIMPVVGQVTGEALNALAQLADSYKTSGLNGMLEDAGAIAAELAGKIASYAPEMVDAAVTLLQSLVKGIVNNSSSLISAAQNIVSVLVDGLIELLPARVRAPVEEAVSAIRKSFEDGGLRSAVETVSNVLLNVGEAAIDLADNMLMPLLDTIDFLGEHLNIIIPIIAAVTAAFAAQSIVSTVTTMLGAYHEIVAKLTIAEKANAQQLLTSNVALTAKQVLVGLVSGQITAVTAAQWLWNAAMNANPIAVVITAIAALAAGILAVKAVMGDQLTAEEKLAQANANLEESSNRLGESFGGIGEAAVAFYEGIQDAESHLSAFNDTLFASGDEQQKLTSNMEEVQNGITSICKTAAEERRGYTEAEIEQLNEYFETLSELNQQQFDIQQQKAEAMKQIAETEAETHQGSLEEYQTIAQEWINTAQEQYAIQQELAEEAAYNEIALLNQKYGEKATMSNEAYAAEYEAIIAKRDQNIAAAQEEVGAVASAYAEGYAQRSEGLQTFMEEYQTYQEEQLEAERLHNEKIQELEDQKAAIDEQYKYDEVGRLRENNRISAEIKNEEARYLEERAKNQDNFNKSFTEDTEKELGTWLTMLAQTEQYGGDISEENQKMVDEILKSYEDLPAESQAAMKDVMSPMLEEMKNSEPGLFEKASGIADGILSRLKKSFDINSPSRKTRKIFRGVMEGGELGLEDEKPKLLRQASAIAESVTQGLQTAKFNASALVQRMKGAISSQIQLVTSPAQASAGQTAAALSYAFAGEASFTGGVHHVEIPVQLDGREIARATAEYTDGELEDIRRRKERGG